VASDENDDDWMTSSEVARHLRVTVTTVSRWIQSGKLPSIRTLGGRYRIPRAGFLALMQKEAPPAPERPSLRVMVVDDEDQIRDMLKSFLESMPDLDVTVETAVDGMAAADRIPEFAPHLLLVDLMMPRMTGFQLAGFVRGHPRTRDARIVILTGFGNPENLSAAEKCGAFKVLQKPFRAETLMEVVRQAARDLLPAALAPEAP